jgi:hypothetical protein
VLIDWVRQRQVAARLAQSDAEALMFAKGGTAYAEAKRRERVSLLTVCEVHDDRRDRTHWRRVAGIIEKHAGR